MDHGCCNTRRMPGDFGLTPEQWKLFDSHREGIVRKVMREHRGLMTKIGRDELEQALILELRDAAISYDPSHLDSDGNPISFTWYAYYKLNNRAVNLASKEAISLTRYGSELVAESKPCESDTEAENATTIADVQELLDELSVPHRRVIVLLFGLGGNGIHKPKDAAKVLGITVQDVHRLAREAMKKLRE